MPFLCRWPIRAESNQDVAIIVGGETMFPFKFSHPIQAGFVVGQNIDLRQLPPMGISGLVFLSHGNPMLMVCLIHCSDLPANIVVYDSLSVGNHIVSLKVEDEVGEFRDAVSVAIGTPPTLTVTSPISGDGYSGDSVPAGVVEDQEDILLKYHFRFRYRWSTSTQLRLNGNIAFGYSGLSAGEQSQHHRNRQR